MTLALSILASLIVIGGASWLVAVVIHLMAAYTDGRVDADWYFITSTTNEDAHTGIYGRAYRAGWMRTVRKGLKREEERERSRRDRKAEASQR